MKADKKLKIKEKCEQVCRALFRLFNDSKFQGANFSWAGFPNMCQQQCISTYMFELAKDPECLELISHHSLQYGQQLVDQMRKENGC